MRNGIFSAIAWALVGVALFVGFVMYVVHDVNESNRKVNRQIQECLAEGGTPIVVGYQYTSELKGCKYP
jgi:hypothetical protein